MPRICLLVGERTPGLIQHVLTVLVFLSWVLFLPRPPPSSRSLRLCPRASILLHGPLDSCLDLLSAAPPPPVQQRDAQHKFLQHRGGTRRVRCVFRLELLGIYRLQVSTDGGNLKCRKLVALIARVTFLPQIRFSGEELTAHRWAQICRKFSRKVCCKALSQSCRKVCRKVRRKVCTSLCHFVPTTPHGGTFFVLPKTGGVQRIMG